MSSKKGESVPPRFDFGVPTTEEASPFGTIKELLAEINRERPDKTGKGTQVDIIALRPTLQFIKNVCGMEINSTTKCYPVAVLKTIKLLYLENDYSGIQFFQYLMPPSLSGKPTLEFRRLGKAPRNEYGAKLFNELIAKLESELDPAAKEQININLLGPAKLLEAIDWENREILTLLLNSQSTANHESIVRGVERLTEAVKAFEVTSAESSAPLDERVYTYLRGLEFAHFVGEDRKMTELSRVDQAVMPVEDQLARFCAEASKGLPMDIQANTRFLAVNNCPEFIEKHHKAFKRLTKAAANFSIRSSEFVETVTFAQQILEMHRFHSHRHASLDAPILSVLDCLAALCAVAYQRKRKINYKPHWVGRERDVGKSPFQYLDKTRQIEKRQGTDSVPHGVMQFLRNLYVEFLMKLTDLEPWHRAYTAFQSARLEKIAETLLVNDIGLIIRTQQQFDRHCFEQAASDSRSA